MNMQDGKNLALAGVSNVWAFAFAIETQTWIAILSAIVLPILFFSVGKAIDVMLQLRFKRIEQAERRLAREEEAKRAAAERPNEIIL